MAKTRPDRVLVQTLLHPTDRDLLLKLSEITGLDSAEVIARSLLSWQIALALGELPVGCGISMDVHFPGTADHPPDVAIIRHHPK